MVGTYHRLLWETARAPERSATGNQQSRCWALRPNVGLGGELVTLETSEKRVLVPWQPLLHGSSAVRSSRSELRRFLETAAISLTAARNAASLTFDGLWKPLTFLTNCSEVARISSSVRGGSKLKRVLMFLHTSVTSMWQSHPGS